MVDRAHAALTRQGRIGEILTWALPFVALVGLAVRLSLYVRRYAVDLLYRDQWDFLDPLFRGEGPWAMFVLQHGPHRQGLGGLVLAWVMPASAWNLRVEALVSVLILLLGAALAWATVRRSTGSPSWTDVTAPLLCLGGGLEEILVGTSNPAHGPIPMALVFALALAWTLRAPMPRAVACSVLGGLATFTGFGFFAGLMNPVLFAAEWVHGRQDGRRRAAAVLGLALAAAVLASFFSGWRFVTAADCFRFPHPHPVEYLDYLGFLLARPLGMHRLGGVRTWLARGVALGALGFTLWVLVRLFRRDEMPVRVVALLVGFTCLFGLNTAAGRVCLGLETAGSARYVPYAAPGWVGLVIAARLRARPRVRWSVVGAVLVLITLRTFNVRADEAWGRHYADGKGRWAACYRQRHDLRGCDLETGFPLHPAPGTTRMQQKLDFLEARHLNLFRTQ
jgi:hypothetical protein